MFTSKRTQPSVKLAKIGLGVLALVSRKARFRSVQQVVLQHFDAEPSPTPQTKLTYAAAKQEKARLPLENKP